MTRGSRQPFHVFPRASGRLREGQILIRDGSTTRGIRHDDLMRLYLQVGNGYAEQLLQQHGALAARTHARGVKQRAERRPRDSPPAAAPDGERQRPPARLARLTARTVAGAVTLRSDPAGTPVGSLWSATADLRCETDRVHRPGRIRRRLVG